jgi:hypothetical protein
LQPPKVSPAPASKAFGSQRVGTTSAAQTFTITNSGGTTLHITTAALAGANANQFVESSDTCDGQAIAPAGHCTVDVAFKPTTAGSQTAALRITSDASSSPDDIALSGSGTAPAVGIDPASKDFGDQTVGTASSSQTFTVTNVGTDTLHITTVTLTGANTNQFAESGNGCDGQAIAVGGHCTVAVAFNPTATGVKTASLQITSDASTSPDSASLTGTGVEPAVTASPASKAFGNERLGGTSPAQTFTITNSGTGTLHITSASLVGADEGQYTESNDGCTGQAIAAGGHCTVDVAFRPASAGPHNNASLEIASNAPSSPDDLALTGTGVVSGLSPVPGFRDFGSQRVGTTSTPQTFTISNTGGTNLHITSASLVGGDESQYAESNDGCSAQTLIPGAHCTVDVAFNPTSSGAHNDASLEITSDAPSSPDDLPLTGTGIESTVSASPATKDFGSQRVGTTSAKQTFTITNTGTAPLNITTAALTGADAAQFTESSDSCSHQAVAAGGHCTVDVAFSPTTARAHDSAELTITSDAASSPDRLALTGTGLAPAIATSPTSKDFGQQAVGTASQPQTFTIANTGTDTLAIATVAITGADSAQFAESANGCNGQSIAPGGHCTVTVAFNPASPGAHNNASLEITSNAPGGPVDVPLAGTGIATLPAGFAVLHVRVHRHGVVTFDVRAPGPGRLTALETVPRSAAAHASRTGRRPLVFAKKQLAVKAPGTLHVTVKPSRTGRKLLAHHRHSVRIKLSVMYKPTGGKQQTKTFRGLLIAK